MNSQIKIEAQSLSIERLIEIAFELWDAPWSDDSNVWNAELAIAELQRRGEWETIVFCLDFCRDPRPEARCIGASILGQFGNTEPDYQKRLFREERFSELSALLFREMKGDADPNVLGETCYALGWLADERVIPLVLPLLHHPHVFVRRGVRHALTGHADARAIVGLIELSRDNEPDVRDWATIALGQQEDVDTPELRQALVDRLQDDDENTQMEAILGLARRKDKRALPALVRALERENGSIHYDTLEAATLFADQALCPSLKTLAAKNCGINLEDLEMAIQACQCLSTNLDKK